VDLVEGDRLVRAVGGLREAITPVSRRRPCKGTPARRTTAAATAIAAKPPF
jgi:hypothetical protein